MERNKYRCIGKLQLTTSKNGIYQFAPCIFVGAFRCDERFIAVIEAVSIHVSYGICEWRWQAFVSLSTVQPSMHGCDLCVCTPVVEAQKLSDAIRYAHRRRRRNRMHSCESHLPIGKYSMQHTAHYTCVYVYLAASAFR